MTFPVHVRPGRAFSRVVSNIARCGGPSCEPSFSATVQAAAPACALIVHNDDDKPLTIMLITSARHSRNPASVPTPQPSAYSWLASIFTSDILLVRCLWPTCTADADIIFCSCGVYLLLLLLPLPLFFFFPRLSSAV